jgi:hypothetical protein
MLPKPVKPVRVRQPLRRGAPLKRGKRPRARKAGATADLRRDATALCSRITLHDAPCISCAVIGILRPSTDAMHVLSKASRPSVRYALENLLPGCRDCHNRLGSATLAGPSPMRDLYEWAWGGPGAWARLVEMSRQPSPYLPEIVAELRMTARRLGIILPPSPAASTARKGKPVAHDRKAPTTKRPKSHQVVKESQAVAPGSVETARRLSGSEER